MINFYNFAIIIRENIYSLFSIVIKSPINDISENLGPNDLPYKIPIHPNCGKLELTQ